MSHAKIDKAAFRRDYEEYWSQRTSTARRYVVHVDIAHRDTPLEIPDHEELHVTAYDSAEAEREVERHNKRATGVDFVAIVGRIEPYDPELHGEWKLGRLL